MRTLADQHDPGQHDPGQHDPVGEPTPGVVWRADEDVVEADVRRRGFVVHHSGRRVPGLLWSPARGGGPRPVVLLGHGGSGSKRQDYVAAMARRLARDHGLAAAAIDGPVHGDRRAGPPAPPALVLAEFAQLWANEGEEMTDAMVRDWTVTLDALQALPEIGSGPAGWWGVSMGTIIGVPVVAAEPRIRVAVLGLMGLTGPTRRRIEADVRRVRCPVLYLVQWDDRLFPRDVALELWDALGSADKRLLAQPGDHGDLPADAFELSAAFLARHLGAVPR